MNQSFEYFLGMAIGVLGGFGSAWILCGILHH